MWFQKEWKVYSAQGCLLLIVEKWKKCLDKKRTCGTFLTDLSKAFNSLPHKFVLAKLNAYGFDELFLKYFTCVIESKEFELTAVLKIGQMFPMLSDKFSVLEPLLFNIFFVVCF